MDCGLFISNQQFGLHELDGNESSPEIGGESPPSSTTIFADHKTTTTSPKRSRRSIQKRVVSIPIKDVEGSRLKGESAPPSDSWAWRKYGQKPIKGSPYPRGYYRCSSSKGCPARKQVERSRLDPTMLVITYSCEHNHPGPASRSNHHNNQSNITVAVSVSTAVETPAPKKAKTTTFTESDPDEKFRDLSEESLTIGDEYGWFGDMASTSSSTILESPILITETNYNIDTEMTMFFPIKEEDESLFADLGELPDCSLVFRRGLLENEEGRRQCTSSPWCGTT